MTTYSRTMKLLLLWTCLPIGLVFSAPELETWQVDRIIPDEQQQWTKRTMTTICVEITPSGPQEEPYYMCRGANFVGENGQQSCVEISNHGGQGGPFYMCRSGPVGENESSSEQQPELKNRPIQQHVSIPTFPSFPAFGGESAAAQQHVTESPHQQASPPHQTSYQQQTQPYSEQQTHGQYGFYGHQLAAPSPAPPAQSYGLSALSYSSLGGTPALLSGIPTGASPAVTTPTNDPAAAQGSSISFREYGLVGSSNHRIDFNRDMLAMPNMGFNQDDLNYQYPSPLDHLQSKEQMKWAPVLQAQDLENDPVMKAFYKSLDVGEPPADLPLRSGKREELQNPIVGQLAPSYSQFPQTSVPPPITYAKPEVPRSYCSICSPSTPPFQCSTFPSTDKGQSYSTPCPRFQPVLITIPCYVKHPTHYLTSAPGMTRTQPIGTLFGLPQRQVENSFGAALEMGGQLGSSLSMAHPIGVGLHPQVGGPFNMGMHFGLDPVMNPFGPFANLNPFNPFNRILGSMGPAAPNDNFFKSVFKFRDGGENSPTPALPLYTEQPSATLAAIRESEKVEGSGDEDDVLEKQSETTVLPISDGDTPLDDLESHDLNAKQLVSKATVLLKTEKRKRHNYRFSSPKKRKYLQQL
ncbi:hypothetical protein KR009_007171 [Drosophila setifemur]|nr:hypothetical protein KR009_007171 [Drosophila setifemur]